MEGSLPVLEGWANFYVIIGSSAAGLTGLTFVVIALVSDAHIVRMSGLRAFVTPIVMHFGAAIWIAVLPTLCYLALLMAGALALRHAVAALYLVGASALTLLFIGVHNAWDLAVWITVERPGAQAQQEAAPSSPSAATTTSASDAKPAAPPGS